MTDNISFKAMTFAKEAHKNQKRKYTNQPYFCHLAEVAGIISSIYCDPKVISIAWLHDTIEDTETTGFELDRIFGNFIGDGVVCLTDSTIGNRKQRKQFDRDRLKDSPSYIQDIKLADLISNTCSIFEFDEDFGKVYGVEKRLMLDCLNLADYRLKAIADAQLIKYGY
jgi:(p)ppGpp synthase/HD superfamily hydrolase